MKQIATLLVFFILSFGAHATDRANKKLAMEYLRLSRVEQIINASLDTYSQQIFKDIAEEDRIQIDKMMQEVIGWEATKDQLAELVVNVYTKAELRAAIAFMKTPLGASYTIKGDAFSAQFANMLSHNLVMFVRDHPIQPNPEVNPDATK